MFALGGTHMLARLTICTSKTARSNTSVIVVNAVLRKECCNSADWQAQASQNRDGLFCKWCLNKSGWWCRGVRGVRGGGGGLTQIYKGGARLECITTNSHSKNPLTPTDLHGFIINDPAREWFLRASRQPAFHSDRPGPGAALFEAGLLYLQYFYHSFKLSIITWRMLTCFEASNASLGTQSYHKLHRASQLD